MLSSQGVFDRVAAHLRKQGVRSISSAGSCRYRGPNGTKCAVGCLIPDDRYVPELEGLIPIALAVRMALEGVVGDLEKGDSVNNRLLHHLRKLHDYTPVEDWEGDLRTIALGFGLVYTPPTSASSEEQNHPN